MNDVESNLSADFLSAFASGDVASAKRIAERLPEVEDAGNRAHPLLREAVTTNGGHCYRESQLQIADLLTPPTVRQFRGFLLEDDVEQVDAVLKNDPTMIDCEFTAGRGVAQPIHHWRSPKLGALLLGAGANIESKTTLGETPLAMQIRFGDTDAVRLLLEHGASPSTGRVAAMPSQVMEERIELLLQFGWKIGGGDLLHDANHGHGERVRTWLRYGADPNVVDEDGRTALHLLAARGAGKAAIRALVEAGANLEQRDNDGDTPLDLALAATRQAAAEELIALGARRIEGSTDA